MYPDILNNIPVGSVCINLRGELGVYTHWLGRHVLSWHGVNFNGGKWSSPQIPTIIAQNINDYLKKEKNNEIAR